ncbi:MAG: diguanylate cyclase [Candidatus Sericytochromatia bacterium]|uniref:Diguanylate cyclase n=1 Tax=Candidatus Tanganyikabacteria bacterium TaxID=2961651 RepID=A0A937X4K8_9BACT|nr:diguanylate cyclase [Candidatus Tanganyikabacteria bacterium]
MELGFPDANTAIGFLEFPMFLGRVSQELTIAGLLKYPYTLVAMAIDQEKELDRRKGLGFGTQFLAELSSALGSAIRGQPTEIRSEIDVVARYEDLFLFSFPNTDFNEAMVPMRRVIDIARRESQRAVGDKEFLLPIACGLLTWEPVSGPIDPADFVYRTIEALYQAKKEAPNKLYLLRLGMKDQDPEKLRVKHNQTAPLRLKTKPIVGLLEAGGTAGPAAGKAAGRAGESTDKNKKAKKAKGKKGEKPKKPEKSTLSSKAQSEKGKKDKAAKPIWKFW